MRVWRCVWLDISTKAVVIKQYAFEKPMSVIITGYLIAISKGARRWSEFELGFNGDAFM
jgi:hypothetical protein